MKQNLYFDKIQKEDVENFQKKIASNIQNIRKKRCFKEFPSSQGFTFNFLMK